jgi:hypothetical protein
MNEDTVPLFNKDAIYNQHMSLERIVSINRLWSRWIRSSIATDLHYDGSMKMYILYLWMVLL